MEQYINTKKDTFDFESYILQHFKYSDGILYRDDRKGSNGSLDKDGYLIIKIKGRQFKAHRIVWFLCKGKFPKLEIDHIDRNRLNNKIENLREVDRQGNVDNRTLYPNKDTGVVGIYKDKATKGLKAVYTFKLKGKTYRFKTLQEAIKEKEGLKNGCK